MSSVVPWNGSFYERTYSPITTMAHVFRALESLARLDPSAASYSMHLASRRLGPDSPLLPLIVPFARSRIAMLEHLHALWRSVHLARASRYFAPSVHGGNADHGHTLTIDAETCEPFRQLATALRMTRDEFRFLRVMAKESRDRREFLESSLAQQTGRIDELRARLDRLRAIVDLENETARLLARIDELRTEQSAQGLSVAAELQIRDTEANMRREYERYLETHEIRMRAKTERLVELERAIELLRVVNAETRRFHDATWRTVRRLQDLVVRTLPDNVGKVHDLCVEYEKRHEEARRDWPRMLIDDVERRIREDPTLSTQERQERIVKLEEYDREIRGDRSVVNSYPRPIDCADVTATHSTYCRERARSSESMKNDRYTRYTKPSGGDGAYAFVSEEDRVCVIEAERLIGYLYEEGSSALTGAMLRAYNIGRPFDTNTMIQFMHASAQRHGPLRRMPSPRFGRVAPELGRFIVSLFAVRYDERYRDETSVVTYMDDRSRVHKSREHLAVTSGGE